DKLTGKIKFIFQPAEEGGAGAKAMIEDGVLENPKVDAIFGLHNHPGSPVGMMLTKPGCAMYGNLEFTLHVHGKGGHAAQPELTINPLIAAADLILILRQLHDDLATGIEPTIITMTQCKSGFTTNVVPNFTYLQGTIRASSRENFEMAKAGIKQSLSLLEKKHHVTIEQQFDEIYPPTINTPAETDFALEQAAICLGAENV
ncbi:MAG TPA: M20/M25/M40 family metallo-hydrolase, partial [Candidatus Berkiella sp.]|nr:M20/M25/M40 family metallo-hydrolase [Candidatus Berkiella sp.]